MPDRHRKVSFDDLIQITETGYIYIWVSNESENTKVWFDDLKITHTQTLVTQATDYGVWGDVIREQKADEKVYRFGYQGQFAEKDEETGWNHFELREYDAVIGRWTAIDPYVQYWSPYIGMGNNPVSGIDPNGGKCSTCPDGAEYDEYRNSNELFAYNGDVGVYNDYGVTIEAKPFSEYEWDITFGAQGTLEMGGEGIDLNLINWEVWSSNEEKNNDGKIMMENSFSFNTPLYSWERGHSQNINFEDGKIKSTDYKPFVTHGYLGVVDVKNETDRTGEVVRSVYIPLFKFRFIIGIELNQKINPE